MTAYYNEIDPFAAAWLRELIKHGRIAKGEVDERSITDVRAADLVGFTQVHLFAGIGGWSLAARLAGWPDDRPLWTGSAPCQPFSSAGRRAGTSDERHLWPVMRDLVAVCRPPVVAGEQVASGLGLNWLASVRSDLEVEGYAVGASDLCAAGTGAPHLRQRLYWGAVKLADAMRSGRTAWRGESRHGPSAGMRPACKLADSGSSASWRNAGAVYPTEAGVGCEGLINGIDSLRYQYGRAACGLADTSGERVRDSRCGPDAREAGGMPSQGVQRQLVRHDARHDDDGSPARVGDAGRQRLQVCSHAECGERSRNEGGATQQSSGASRGLDDRGWSRPIDGGWADADWLFCRDGKWRPVESGSFPLAHGVPNRVGRLRGYGNAIVPQVAATFLRALVDDLP